MIPSVETRPHGSATEQSSAAKPSPDDHTLWPRGGPLSRPYPPGMRWEIPVEQYRDVLDLLEQTTRPRRNEVAFVCKGKTLTFAEVFAQAEALAKYLGASAGIRVGDRTAVLLPNVLEFPVSLLGNLRAGAAQISLNPLFTSRELQAQLIDSGARVLIAHATTARVAKEALVGTAVERVLVVGESSGEAWAGVLSERFDAALEAGSTVHAGWELPRISRDDLALLQYTGGTTGSPKAAELTHGNMLASALQVRSMLEGIVEYGAETILTALPLYHIFALAVNLVVFMSFGARNVLLENPRDTDALAAAFLQDGITIMTGVNTLYAALVALPQLKGHDLSRIKLAIGGGTAVHRATSEAWRERTGRHILEGYGLSETTCVVTLNPYTNPDFTASVGLPLPSTEVVILDDAGRVLGVGEEGEICVRGPQLTRGYWNKPEATRAAFTEDGFFRTGDIGTIDSEGFVRICDRKKDMVIVSGFNVYPNEIEEVLSALDGVRECAVTGLPDAKTGEAVRATIVRGRSTLTREEVAAHCRGQLAAYKVPKVVEFVETLPKSVVGKILRREVRAGTPAPANALAPQTQEKA